MTDHTDEILSLLPVRLKDARQSLGLSLDAVAKLSGVSRSMVSQIERGESSPTIATLWNLTRALQVDFAGLLEEGPAGDVIEVIRKDEAPRIDNCGDGCAIRILSPPEDVGKHEVYELSFARGGQLNSQPHRGGSREQICILSGTLVVQAGETTQVLNAGDTARYPVDVPHCISAKDGEATAILIVQDA
ncbi:MAG: helix-turn-helix transcriptional regulator [Rhodobacteraceae bacterium]|nr:helix-turn-helix transcriptional regulator [Paracoccaceae bacterium]